MESNLVLTGFMGTGKTTVGQLIARRLGRQFVDTDQWIEERTGRTVQTIFAEEGEDRFRAWEAEACEALSEAQDLIIATGGWTLGPQKNREALQRGGCVICLWAEPDEILKRLHGARHRPLLAGDDPEAKLRELLQKRSEVYRSFAWQVDTTQRDVAEVMLHVMALYGMVGNLNDPDTFYVPMGERGNTVLLGANLLDSLGPVLSARGLRGTVALIGDSNVIEHHGERTFRSLAMSGFEVRPVRVPAGEESKTLEMAGLLYEQLVQGGLERSGAIVALGGGVIGDLSGFVAATYLRGVPWVCCATTLLSMVDASIGGKTGVDLPAGKNLVGAFHPPWLTISDLTTLQTLPEREFQAGLAEVLKAGVIGDAELFELIESGSTDVQEIIRRAIKVKVDVVREDPFEKGRRAALNLGHTIGHGLEAASQFLLRHGEAIGIGLIAETKIAERLGLANKGLSDRFEAVIAKVGLPTRYANLETNTIMELMRSDKKKQLGRLKFALPRAIGDVVIGVDVEDDLIREALEAVREK
ncbi:MAG TPA: 3-dehydroquinate synthase [Anaerolineae bacterium]|nr:3-dehydroquinate synthase [Anaerolineae bacterium]